MEICARECEKYEAEEDVQEILKETIGQMENSTTLDLSLIHILQYFDHGGVSNDRRLRRRNYHKSGIPV